MPSLRSSRWIEPIRRWLQRFDRRGRIISISFTVILAALIGILAGYGAALFGWLIHSVSAWTVEPFVDASARSSWWLLAIVVVPAIGLLGVSWFTRRFAPEAQGHGVPEVIMAVAREDGVIRPRVSIVKILASGFCIGTGGSVGREGPIVQIGSALGSAAGQTFRLSARNIKVLVAAGAAAGISATFNAPIAGVVFSAEIILGSFAVESLTPIIVAAVLANVVQGFVGEHGQHSAFVQLQYHFDGQWQQLLEYFALGLLCGLFAVGFTKVLYATEDLGKRLIPKWWARALVFGGIVGLFGAFYPSKPPQTSRETEVRIEEGRQPRPPLFGVGYEVADHALHLESAKIEKEEGPPGEPSDDRTDNGDADKSVELDHDAMLRQLWWFLPLVFLKPLLTSITLAGGGSGGIFAPSLFLGATLGACFGLVCNLIFPDVSANPGVYAIVGMGAVVAGTTHGILSAILIVYEMTNDYRIILPIMVAAGLASVVARIIDPESIYHKKLSRRGESLARGHDAHNLEHIMVRDVMLRHFPTVRQSDNVTEIVRVARENSSLESLPVMDDAGRLVGIIRPEDLHRVLDSEIAPHLLYAEDIAARPPISVSPNENLLEALRDFGTRDIETLPVEVGQGESRRLVGLLQREDVMRRYRAEMLEPR